MALPEKLVFHAVPGILAPMPRLFGNTAQYVGRRLDYEAIKANTELRGPAGGFFAQEVLHNLEACYPIDAAFNSEFTRDHGVHVLGELARMAKHGDIVPADAVTAKWSGVKFKAQVVSDNTTSDQPTTVDEQPKAARKTNTKREAT